MIKKSTALITRTQYGLSKQKTNETIDTQPRMGNPLTIFHGTRFINILIIMPIRENSHNRPRPAKVSGVIGVLLGFFY